MTNHFDRFMDGASIVIILLVLYVIFQVTREYVIPVIMAYSTILLKIGTGFGVFIIASYLIGYMVTDFYHDLKEYTK